MVTGYTLQMMAIILRAEGARQRVGRWSCQGKCLVTSKVDVSEDVQLNMSTFWATGAPFLPKPSSDVRDVPSFITVKKLQGGRE